VAPDDLTPLPARRERWGSDEAHTFSAIGCRVRRGFRKGPAVRPYPEPAGGLRSRSAGLFFWQRWMTPLQRREVLGTHKASPHGEHIRAPMHSRAQGSIRVAGTSSSCVRQQAISDNFVTHRMLKTDSPRRSRGGRGDDEDRGDLAGAEPLTDSGKPCESSSILQGSQSIGDAKKTAEMEFV
jgi:hypothetical protein